MKIYIAGPMTGYKDHNFPAFYECEETLKKLNKDDEIVNPATITGTPDPSKSWADYMKQDIQQMSTCDAIILLEGWERSKGAAIEYNLAKTLEMKIYEYNSKEKTMTPMLEKKGLKFDGAKLRYDLIPTREFQDTVKVMTFGSLKYEDNNWQKVANPYDTYYAAIQRHITAWRQGETYDPETGISHLAHAGCSLLFLQWFDNEKEQRLEEELLDENIKRLYRTAKKDDSTSK